MISKITFAFLTVLATASAQQFFSKSFRVVSLENDLNFIQANAFTASVNGIPELEPILKGSRFLQNGSVFRANKVKVTPSSNELLGYPQNQEGDRYTSECTCMEGEGLVIEQNICNYNLCDGDSCLFLRSGGNFNLNVLNQSPAAVPVVVAKIIAGTGRFKKVQGQAVIITLSVPANNGPSSSFPGSSVLEVLVGGTFAGG